MIGYICGKYIASEDNLVIIDVGGVGYSVLVSAQQVSKMSVGQLVELYVHTNLRENALELFGFASLWEKKVFQALISVSGVGPKSGLAILNAVEPAIVLSAIMREDRAVLTSVSGIGKKTAELLIIGLAEKARKLLSERPQDQKTSAPLSVTAAEAPGLIAAAKKSTRSKKEVPPQGASASPITETDIADLWNEALAALVNLGYREIEAISAIKAASNKAAENGESLTLPQLVRGSLQLMSKGISR